MPRLAGNKTGRLKRACAANVWVDTGGGGAERALRAEVHALADDLGALLAKTQGLSHQLVQLAVQRGALVS